MFRFVRCITHAGTRRLLLIRRIMRIFRAKLLRRVAMCGPFLDSFSGG
jgi:hypothetical protein